MFLLHALHEAWGQLPRLPLVQSKFQHPVYAAHRMDKPTLNRAALSTAMSRASCEELYTAHIPQQQHLLISFSMAAVMSMTVIADDWQ